MPIRRSNSVVRNALLLLLSKLALSLLAPASFAGPALVTGDGLLRNDIQLLADYGVIRGPVSTWPLAWGPVLDDIASYDGDVSAPALSLALQRLRLRAEWETRQDELLFNAGAGVAEKPTRVRGYHYTPRGNAEVSGGLSWTGRHVSVSLTGVLVDPGDNEGKVRMDGSSVGFALGNWTLSLNTLDRWWGPGWDGSLILSSNARPLPAISFDRNFTDAFASRWLSWLGPWDLNIMMGQLESERAVSDALLFGMRVNFRPHPSLEIGLSRTAQWCGEGRPCEASTLANLLIGRDNRGGSGVDFDNEPGNQLAGVDFRWGRPVSGMPFAVYGQFIGEDEAGGFPSRYLGQVGVEASGVWRDTWSWRWYGEYAGTKCQFFQSDDLYNCGYNHSIYSTGYRYRDRTIGHGADNDAKIVSMGVMLASGTESEWRATVRSGTLNDGGEPDYSNTLTAFPQDLQSFDLSHSRRFIYGKVEAGIGFESTQFSGASRETDTRFYVQWRSTY